MRKVLVGLAAISFLGSLLAVSSAPASAAVTFTQDYLSPKNFFTVAGASVKATLKLHSSACTSVLVVTIAVRDSAGNNVDFPGAIAPSQQICPGTNNLVYVSGTRTFAAGTYNAFGAVLLTNNTWVNLPTQSFTISPNAPSWNHTGTYTLQKQDEFTAETLDTTLWENGWYPVGGATITKPGNSLGCYDTSYVTQTGDGYLNLKLSNTPSTLVASGVNVCSAASGRGYTGGVVSSRNKFSQAGGSFEARLYLPPTSSNTAAGWPAWWMNGLDSQSWPLHGEIDVVEGLQGQTSSYVHYFNAAATGPDHDAASGGPTASPYVGWHTFGAKWTTSTGTVQFYWDGVAKDGPRTMTATLAEYLVFDYTMDVGSGVATWPQTMKVDWVRVWQ
jgi:beta-glucanase (GH16 family)